MEKKSPKFSWLLCSQFVQKLTLARLLEYQEKGNHILGAVYNDKREQVNVADQFKYMLSYTQVLPRAHVAE